MIINGNKQTNKQTNKQSTKNENNHVQTRPFEFGLDENVDEQIDGLADDRDERGANRSVGREIGREIVVLDHDEAQVLEQRLHELETERMHGPVVVLLNLSLVLNVRVVVLYVGHVQEDIN